MEKFKKFEIQKKEVVFGGQVGGGNMSTHWYGFNHTSGIDVFDTYTGDVIYL